jgi:hypothetical protein
MMRRAVFIRLATFFLVIAGSFGTAYGVGRMLPSEPDSPPHPHGTSAVTVVEP